MKRRSLINVFLVLLLTAAPAFAAEAESSPPSGQIRQWIDQLNAERFVDREVATEKLIAAGAASVGPTLAVVAENNLEVTTRAVYVLQELALSPDIVASEAAHAALEKIAEPRLTSAARLRTFHAGPLGPDPPGSGDWGIEASGGQRRCSSSGLRVWA